MAPAREFLFGATRCRIETEMIPGARCNALVFVVGADGRTAFPIAHRNTIPAEFPGESEDLAIGRACEYLEDRFGPRTTPGDGEEPKVRYTEEKPFRLWWIEAKTPIHHGQRVRFSANGAREFSAGQSDHLVGIARADIGVGQRGWIEEEPPAPS